MPIDPVRLGALLDEQDSLATRQTALAAPSVSPDDMAKAQRIAQARNLPPLVVADNLADFDEQDRLDRVTALARGQPKLGTFLQDPQNAALARGEEDQIGLFGRTLAAWYESPLNAPMRGLQRSELGASIQSGATASLASLWHTLTDTVDRLAQKPMRDLTSQLTFTDDEGRDATALGRSIWADPLGAQAQAEESLAVSREVKVDQHEASARVGQRPVFDDFVRDPNRAIEQLFAYYANLGGQSVPQVALAVATRNPAVGGAVMGTTSGSQTFTDLRADGVDRFRAGMAGAASGLFETALGRTGLEAATAPGVRALLLGPPVEAGTEALTTAGQVDVEDWARMRRTPLAQKLSAMLDAGVVGFGFGVGEKSASSVLDVVAGDRPVTRRRTAEALMPVLRSLDNAARVTALTEQASALKLGERSPQTLAAFVDHVGGGEVYLAADQARTLFQSERVSADQALGELLGAPDALALAEATGGDVVIPMAVYASAIARLPNAAEIAKHVRLHPEDYSAADLDGGKAEEELAALFGNTDDAAARAAPVDGDMVDRIRQDVLGQLQGTGRYSPADAERQANLYAAIFRALSQRTGRDAWALYDRYSLRIRGSQPNILRQRPNALTAETDALLTAARVGEIPSEAEAFGPSLVEFLRDRGIGAADGMEGEVRRLRESERVGNARQRRLFRDDDAGALSLHRAREAAAEAGYLPSDSTLSDFLDLLEQDIGGRRVTSPANENRKVIGRRNEVLSLQEAMAEAFPDAAELAGLSNQQIAERLFGGAALNQDGITQEDHAAQMRGRRMLRDIGPESTAAEITAAIEKLEAVKTRLRDLKGEPTPSAESLDEADAASLAAFWLALAGDDGLFAFATPDRAVTDLQALADEIAPGFVFENTGKVKGDTTLPTMVERFQITTPLGKTGTFDIEPGGELQLHIGEFARGSTEGQQLYTIFNTWAARNGLKALPDRGGLTAVNMLRRTELMLSSALREGSTEHLAPAESQGLGRWRGADDFGEAASTDDQAFNTGYLAVKAAEATLRAVPLLDRLRYNFDSQRFEDVKGREFTDDDFAALSSQLAAGKAGVGSRSLKRALVTRSALRELHGSGLAADGAAEFGVAARVGLGPELQGDDPAGVVRPLAGILYQSQTPPNGGVFASGPFYSALAKSVTDAMREAALAGQPLFQQTAGAPRGQIDIAPDLRMSITLLEGADLSTFLHESGHFFLEVMADLAADTPALAADFDTALVWMGVPGETSGERAELWASMTLDERRPMHEQFARGFEAYLAEGKAPSVDLASVFGRFKAWMLAVYRSLAQLDVTLTDEVRGVFDRLLATDDEIALVEQRQGMAQPLVEASEFKSLGLTEAQWADYRGMLEAASEEARAEVFAKLHKAYRREAESWWKEERAKVRAEVSDEFEAEPAVRAWRILTGRKIEGLDPALQGLKLDRDSLLDTYAKEYVQTRLRPLGVYAVKGGVSADTAAALLGLPSGDALVQGLATVKERLARVEAETDARMRERHPDPMADGSLPEMAERAVHNAARVKALQFELDLLARLAGQPAPTARAIRLFAQQEIAARQIKGLRPNDFLAAERRAARETTKAAAKGDFALALKHKRDQAVQAVLYSEARAALDQVERHVDYARKFDKTSTRSRIGKAGGDLLEMIDGILGVYAFRPQSDKARDRAASLRQWYDRMLAQGVQPQVDAKVLATIEASRLTHYRDLTVGELSAVVELVKQLEHQAGEANALRLAGEALDLETEAENLSAAVMAGLEHRGPPPISNTLRQSPGEVSKKGARMLAGVLLRLRTLAHWVDGGGNVEGAFHRLIVRPLDRAQAAYLDAMGDYGQRVIALFDAHMQGADLTAPVWIHSLNQNLTKADILAAALNTGNASNLQRLKDGMGWGDVQMTDVLRQMGEADWQFVQGVWDTLESLWPQIAEQQKRLTGIAPPKIDAIPVPTPWGTLRGGYYPVMYDKDSPQWEGVFGKADESLFDPMAITALPAQGHTKSRVDQARIPLKLDLAGIPAHLSNVLKDLTHRETLIGMRKLLARPEVVASLHSTLGPEASRFINDKLKHVATDQVYQFAGTMKAVANFSHGLRRHVGVMAMGYSVVTGLKQVLGFSTALEVLTERVGVMKAPRALAKGYLEVLRGRGASIEAVRALSGEMRHRLDTVDADVRNLYQQYLSGRMAQGAGAKAGRAYDAFRFHAFAIIRYAQGYLVDIPTWLAAHHAAQQQGLTGDAAVAFADDVMIASQGAGGAKDQALIEANIPGVELFTMFYSYANAYFNRQLTLGRDVGKSLQGGPAQFFAELPVLSARFAYLAVVPMILEELIAQAVGQSDGPDDDDDIAAYYGLRMLAYQFYGVPILRDLVPKWAGTQKGAYRMSSAQSAMESLGRLVTDIEKTVQGDAPEARKATRDIVMAAGYTFGLPLGGPWKHVDYLWRYFEGEEDPESVPEFAAALAAGKREQQ